MWTTLIQAFFTPLLNYAHHIILYILVLVVIGFAASFMVTPLMPAMNQLVELNHKSKKFAQGLFLFYFFSVFDGYIESLKKLSCKTIYCSFIITEFRLESRSIRCTVYVYIDCRRVGDSSVLHVRSHVFLDVLRVFREHLFASRSSIGIGTSCRAYLSQTYCYQ